MHAKHTRRQQNGARLLSAFPCKAYYGRLQANNEDSLAHLQASCPSRPTARRLRHTTDTPTYVMGAAKGAR